MRMKNSTLTDDMIGGWVGDLGCMYGRYHVRQEK